jgi:GT2 family glycosyltransferase
MLERLQEINRAVSVKFRKFKAEANASEERLRRELDLEIESLKAQLELAIDDGQRAYESAKEGDAKTEGLRHELSDLHAQVEQLLLERRAAQERELATSDRWRALLRSILSDYETARRQKEESIRERDELIKQISDPSVKEVLFSRIEILEDKYDNISPIVKERHPNPTQSHEIESLSIPLGNKLITKHTECSTLSVSSLQGNTTDDASEEIYPDHTQSKAYDEGQSMTLEELLAFHDEAFVRNVYQAILKRPADPVGLKFYTGKLRRGMSRLQVLSDLARSGEGKIVNADIPGLQAVIRRFRRARWLTPRYVLARFITTAEGDTSTKLMAIENQLARLLTLAQSETRQPFSGEPYAGTIADPQNRPTTSRTAAKPSIEQSATSQSVAELMSHVETVHGLSGERPPTAHLTADRGVPLSLWPDLSTSLLESLWSASTSATEPIQFVAEHRLWIVLSGGQTESLSQTTAESIREFKRLALFDVEIASLGPSCPTAHKALESMQALVKLVSPSDLVMFLGPNDVIDTRFAKALTSQKCWDYDFILTDQVFVEGEFIYVVPFHGIDPVHAAACDYFHSRFIASGRALGESSLTSYDTPYEFAAAFIQLTVEHKKRQLHLQFPFIRNGALGRTALDQSRRELLRTLSSAFTSPGETALGSVSAIICTKDCGYLLDGLITLLLRHRLIKDIVIVSNNTSDDYSLMLLDQLACNDRCKVLVYDKPFNFSEQCNLGAKASQGDYLLFLNDDISPVNSDWLDIMLSDISCDEDRIVGPLLLYPDQTIQHGGMYIGFNGCAGHAFRHLRHPHGAPMYELVAPRQVSCLTGATLLMKRSVFDSLNGFDVLLATMLQDVDLSMRAVFSGIRLIFDPRAILFHMESVTIKETLSDEAILRRRDREYAHFRSRWHAELGKDQWFNRTLDAQDESWRRLKVAS